jgi:hypothetical protein
MLFLPYREWPLALQARSERSFSPHLKSSQPNQIRSKRKRTPKNEGNRRS